MNAYEVRWSGHLVLTAEAMPDSVTLDAPIFEFFKRVWSQHGSEFINGLDHSDLPTNISYISTIVATTWLCVSCHLVSLPGKQGGATGALTRVQHKLVLAFKG